MHRNQNDEESLLSGMVKKPALHTWCAGVCPAAGTFCKALAASAIQQGLE